jgi:hypothetical protein
MSTGKKIVNVLVKQTACTGPSCPTSRETGDDGYFTGAFGFNTFIYIPFSCFIEASTLKKVHDALESE